MSKTIVVLMDTDKITKGAVRFAEVMEHGGNKVVQSEGAIIGTLYMRKDGLTKHGIIGTPKQVKVTIEVD